ncbi:mucin-associated surface protein [Pseudarthrobacter albicanus]|uniref:mucin-associated surface protein n=1 Tax=Pseudarthrobacter albicanus TaxID=2823873 RepID=UPI001FE84EA4|nr:mucin-associated surface protein [Pseudarthrobacter albicanus]
MSPSTTGRRRRGRCPRRRSETAVFLACAVLFAGALAGCGAPPELRPDAARALQTQVLAVTEAAAAEDPAGSLRLLDALATRLDQAAASGDVSFKRHQNIQASIAAVRTDLTAQQAAEEDAARAAAAAAAAPPPAVVVPAPVPANNGKAKAKDKGND